MARRDQPAGKSLGRRPEDWFSPVSPGSTTSDIDTALAARDINTTAPITGGGNLSGDLTLVLSGTKVQFNTACSDDDFIFASSSIGELVDVDITGVVDGDGLVWVAANSRFEPAAGGGGGYSNENAQDAVGAMIDASLTYVDATPLLQRSALTGDVTAPAGSNATTIAADTVTYSKMQNVSATVRILGRKTAGAGDVEECTLSEILDFIGSAAHGDILYRDSAAWDRLPAGTAGKILTTQGAGADPTWETPGTARWLPTEPVAADFSTVRNGLLPAPTIANLTASPGVVWTHIRNATGSSWRQGYLLQSVAGGNPFRAEAMLTIPWDTNNNYHLQGLAIGTTNASDVANHIMISTNMDSNQRFPYSRKHTGLNAQEVVLTTINTPTTIAGQHSIFWMAIEWDGTDINTYASWDGYTWWLHGSEPDTFFVGTPDLVGFGCEAVASDGGTQTVWCPHFKVTTTLSDPLGLNA